MGRNSYDCNDCHFGSGKLFSQLHMFLPKPSLEEWRGDILDGSVR